MWTQHHNWPSFLNQSKLPSDDDSVPPLIDRQPYVSSSDDDSSIGPAPHQNVPSPNHQGDISTSFATNEVSELRSGEESSGPATLTRSMYHIKTMEDSQSMYQIDMGDDDSMDADDDYGFSHGDEEADFQ